MLQEALSKVLLRLKLRFPDITPVLQPAAGTSAAIAAAAGSSANLDTSLHISLSRTVPIKHRQIQSLTTQVARNIRKLPPYSITLTGLRAMVNEDRTRSFVCLDVAAGRRNVVEMVAAVDRAFIMHGLPGFHEHPQPHLSFGWLPGDKGAELTAALAALAAPDLPASATLAAQHVMLRAGSRDTVVWSAADEGQWMGHP